MAKRKTRVKEQDNSTLDKEVEEITEIVGDVLEDESTGTKTPIEPDSESGDEVTDPAPIADATPEVVTPKTKPEVKVPEVKVPATKPVPEVKSKELTIDNVNILLKTPGKTIKQKLQEISENGPVALRSLISKLDMHNEQCGPKAADRGLPFLAGRHYDLYNTLKQVVETKDQKQFTVKMDIVNLMFLQYKDEAFKDVKLTRGDFYWQWGEKSLETYINLVTLICNLANLETRAKTAKNLISPEKATDIETTTLSEVAVANIRKYYN